ncbi:RNA-directed DNA polymerase [candidate division KSB1 bacterium]|nr:RNA-directed DNA polymerase [candidate division KSB1 bacterium]
MKSYSNLFDQICAFENLYLASKKAEKGKRFRHEVAAFNARRYVWQLDIRKYFPSIDHQILLAEISRTIRCPQTLALIEQIISTSNLQEPSNFYFPGDDLFTPYERRKGLPIGNLTSQFFANVYLNAFDHFVKEELRIPSYIRYVDDALAFSDDKEQLREGQIHSQTFLDGWRLLLNPKKNVIYQTQQGIPFLGFRVYPTHRRLLRSSVKRSRKRLRALCRGYRTGRFSREKINASVQAWLGHVRHGDTWGLRQALFRQYTFSKPN